MATRKKKTWMFRPEKLIKPKVKIPDDLKVLLQKKGDEIVEKIFKPECLKPIPKKLKFNQIVDIYTKWYRNSFFFCANYQCPPDSCSSHFESKFAKIEYVGNNKFEFSEMMHNGQWFNLSTGELDACLKQVSSALVF